MIMELYIKLQARVNVSSPWPDEVSDRGEIAHVARNWGRVSCRGGGEASRT